MAVASETWKAELSAGAGGSSGGGSWPGAIGEMDVSERLPVHCKISPSKSERTRKPFAEGAMVGLSLALPLGMARPINRQRQHSETQCGSFLQAAAAG